MLSPCKLPGSCEPGGVPLAEPPGLSVAQMNVSHWGVAEHLKNKTLRYDRYATPLPQRMGPVGGEHGGRARGVGGAKVESGGAPEEPEALVGTRLLDLVAVGPTTVALAQGH